MSVEALLWARDKMTGVREGSYLLLLVLALKHREGPIREPIYEIAHAAHMSHSTVTRHLDALTAVGAVTYTPATQRGKTGSITLHTDKVVTPDDLTSRSSGSRTIAAARSARLQTLKAAEKARRSSGLQTETVKVGRVDDLAPPHPPIRNSYLSNGGTGNYQNVTPTPREAVYAELRQLGAGDLMPADLSPRALAVFNALPSAGSIGSLSALADAWTKTEGGDDE